MKVMRQGNNTEEFVVIWLENRFLFGADFVHMSFFNCVKIKWHPATREKDFDRET